MVPADFGFKMPPEWSEHSGTLMEWPVMEALWPEPFEEILAAFADIVMKIADFEPVTLITRPELAQQAREYCGPRVNILEIENDDSWVRDNGPTFVVNPRGEIAGINWRFNAWGGKYPCGKDNLVAPKVLQRLGVPCFDAPIFMEGGSIHVDGEGTLLTTEECLLNNNRNPHLQREYIEDVLKKYLNIEKIIWLEKGLFGDDTDGHIDNVACFGRPGVIITQTCSDPGDPNYERSQQNLEALQKAADAKGSPFKIIRVEQPPVQYYEGVRLTLSYLNFYFVNGGIIMPVFGGECSEADKQTQLVLEQAFPDRKVVTVNGLAIARGGGNVHCLTQQIPAGIPAKLGICR